MGRLVVSSKGLAWFQKRHPWIFRDDLQRIEDAAPGGIVTLESNRGTFLGQGFFSDRSKIAFRLLSRSSENIDPAFWRRRIQQAHRFRQWIVARTNAYRLVYGESDGLPSLIVDRYGDHFVIQSLSQGVENILPLFTEILLDLFHPSSLVLRNDLSVRGLEGLAPEKKILQGTVPPRVEVYEGDIRYQVDLWSGQKTGSYLDQRENRLRAGDLLQGRVLDAFCYQGLFALHAARRCKHVTAVDSSQEALDLAKENAHLNSISNVEWIKGNVFDFLKSQSEKGERFDGIILDPPAFAKSRENIGSATRGYKELNLRAMKILAAGGLLITASCSYNLMEEKFSEILRESARDSASTFRIIERRTQGPDHPIHLSFPESYYLKCFFLQKAD